jgi:Xaa-Pro aminopeptidase
MRRAFISGFTGSAGTALILRDKALLWTDGRYWLQASQELSDEWILMKSGEQGVPELNEWLASNLSHGQIVGVDAFLVSASEAKKMTASLASKGIQIKPVLKNPVDTVWDRDGSRPQPPVQPAQVHDISVAGSTHSEKIHRIQEFVREKKASAVVFSALDEIAWLLNIRGSDVDFNPVVISYVVVTLDSVHFFVDPEKVRSIMGHLTDGRVTVHRYEEVEDFLGSLQSTDSDVLVDPVQLNWRLYMAVTNTVDVISPITLMKAVKNESELDGIRACHVRDGAALTAFLHWLENTIRGDGNGKLSEYDVAEKLEEFRKRGSPKEHVSPSFSTIAGFGPNGAIIHYKPEKDTAATLRTGPDAMFLLDSGAQYLDGTTDVTRTLHFGEPSNRMKKCYTAVLQVSNMNYEVCQATSSPHFI